MVKKNRAPGVVPTSLAVPGIAGATVPQQSVPPRSVGLHWVRPQPAPIPTMAPPAAITLIRRATEELRMASALFGCRPGELAILATHRRANLASKSPALEKPIAPHELLNVEGSSRTSGCWVRSSDFA